MEHTIHRPVTIHGTRLERPRHVCCFFDSPAQQSEVLAPYIAEGLANREKVMCVLDRDQIGPHHACLDAAGIDSAGALAHGHLCTHPSESTYLEGGTFVRARMLELLRQELKSTAAAGYTALRTLGDMGWVMRNLGSYDDAIAYENDVNDFLNEHDATFLCIYDINRITATMMRDILATHTHVFMGGIVYQNQYAIPPERYRQTLLARREATGRVLGNSVRN